MERLKYIVEDNTIAELLGIENFNNKESAILELVKNSYDAQASYVTIKFLDNKLQIIDDGCGMNADDIHNHWMHVGKSEKGYCIYNKNRKETRILAGSKGVGRFALARLGSYVTVFTKKRNDIPVKWETNWNESILEKWTGDTKLYGTKIVISNLRDRWTERSAKNLADYLSIAYNDTIMKITVVYEDKQFVVSRYFKKAELGKNCASIIKLKYKSDNKALICDIYSDEFQEEAQKYYPSSDLIHFQKILDITNELGNDPEVEVSGIEFDNLLKELGDFSAEFYFSLKSSTTQDADNFLYKYQNISERYDNGVVLYRNAFSISSYEGKRDWLGFGKRTRKSPAAATHQTGAWRVRENQISGKVIIDKKVNYNLQDLSNRQGMEENISYIVFVKILIAGIAIFERHRQEIIRAINIKNDIVPEEKTTIINKIIKNPKSIAMLSYDETKALAIELVSMQQATKVYKDEKESTEQRYRYDVRILNVFATSGLKAASIAHELKNDRNSINTNYENIVEALKNFGLWEELNLPEYTEHAYQNVPNLLLKNKKIDQKLLAFLDTMLDESEKKRFEPSIQKISPIMNDIKLNWKRDYIWIDIENEIDNELEYYIAEDALTVIFDNLILNSIQQNEQRSKLNIIISVIKKEDELLFSYHDDGNGLPQKYINEPNRILIVHETSRKNGHGLGMWIVNNTVVMTGGKILKIDGHNGFSINFTLGEKL